VLRVQAESSLVLGDVTLAQVCLGGNLLHHLCQVSQSFTHLQDLGLSVGRCLGFLLASLSFRGFRSVYELL